MALEYPSYQIGPSSIAPVVIPSADNREKICTLAIVALEAVESGVGALSTADAFPSNVLSKPQMSRTSRTSPGRSGVFRTSCWPV